MYHIVVPPTLGNRQAMYVSEIYEGDWLTGPCKATQLDEQNDVTTS